MHQPQPYYCNVRNHLFNIHQLLLAFYIFQLTWCALLDYSSPPPLPQLWGNQNFLLVVYSCNDQSNLLSKEFNKRNKIHHNFPFVPLSFHSSFNILTCGDSYEESDTFVQLSSLLLTYVRFRSEECILIFHELLVNSVI
jgi:hypothetical protein